MIKPTTKKTNKGCFGRRIKIEPQKSDILGQDDIVQRGLVVAVGPDVKRCRAGDTVVFNNDGLDKERFDDKVFYYILETDSFIYEIL